MKLPFKKRKKYKLRPAQKAKGIRRDHPGFVRGDISHKTGSLKRVSRVTPESLPALSSGTPDSQIPLRPQRQTEGKCHKDLLLHDIKPFNIQP